MNAASSVVAVSEASGARRRGSRNSPWQAASGTIVACGIQPTSRSTDPDAVSSAVSRHSSQSTAVRDGRRPLTVTIMPGPGRPTRQASVPRSRATAAAPRTTR